HQLRALGVGRGDVVGLFLERSIELEPALLGVLRAGAAYVPVDTGFPAERVRYILSDAAVRVVLTLDRLADRVPDTGAAVFRLDGDWAQAAARPTTPPPDEAKPDDLAYVIYTSGSTGRPKGVALPHRAVVNFLCAMADEPGLSADAVVGAANTISCDMPVLDLYLPLLSAARIELIGPDDVIDGERLAERLDAAGVTFLQGTP